MYTNLGLLVITLFTFGVSHTDASQLTTGCNDFTKVIESTVHLDPTRYDGVWFEQVRTRNSPFEDGCFCAEANYTIATDGSIVVDNSCRRGSATAPISSAVGKAVIPDDKHPGFLLVSFWIPFLKAPYAVIDTDYDNYSIIASCPRYGFGNGHIWILTREQQPGIAFINGLKNKTADMGFSRADFVDTYQGDYCNTAPGVYTEPVVTWDDYF